MFGNQGTYKNMEYEPYLSLQDCKNDLNKKGISEVLHTMMKEGQVEVLADKDGEIYYKRKDEFGYCNKGV